MEGGFDLFCVSQEDTVPILVETFVFTQGKAAWEIELSDLEWAIWSQALIFSFLVESRESLSVCRYEMELDGFCAFHL